MNDFQRALDASMDELVEDYKAKAASVPDIPYSRNHYRYIKKLAKSVEKQNHRRGSSHARSTELSYSTFARRRRLMMVCILIAVMAISSIGVYAIVKLEYLTKINKKTIEWELTFQKKNDGKEISFAPKVIEPPEGYVEVEKKQDDEEYLVQIFETKGNHSKQILYKQLFIDESTVVGLDAENDSMKRVKMNGVATIVSKNGKEYSLYWVEGNSEYYLLGNCSMDVLKKIQEKIQK